MIKVEFCSKLQTKERPVAFQVCDRRYRIKEIVDRWYGVGEVFLKVEADDDNIYLLKYEEGQGCWDLIFYQNISDTTSTKPIISPFFFIS